MKDLPKVHLEVEYSTDTFGSSHVIVVTPNGNRYVLPTFSFEAKSELQKSWHGNTAVNTIRIDTYLGKLSE